MNFPQENKVFQRPRRSDLLPSLCFATTVVNYYDHSSFSMTGSLGKGSEKVLGRVLEKGSQKGSEKWSEYGFYIRKWFREGFSERVLRRGLPEGA